MLLLGLEETPSGASTSREEGHPPRDRTGCSQQARAPQGHGPRSADILAATVAAHHPAVPGTAAPESKRRLRPRTLGQNCLVSW